MMQYIIIVIACLLCILIGWIVGFCHGYEWRDHHDK